MKNSRNKNFPMVFAAVAILMLLGYAGWRSTAADYRPVINGPLPKAIVYRSPTCGCCGIYASYLKRMGFDVKTEFVEAADRLDLGVPNSLASCHTTVIGDYVVEGHVPVEAIAKLLNEKPDIAGIGMPGMPSGSPGMPGRKVGDFDISSFRADGASRNFMKL